MAAVAAGSLLGAGWAVVAGVAVAGVAVPYGWAVGRVRAYPASLRGVALFAVDHSWSLVNTIAGAGFLAVNLARGHHLDPPRCCHRGRIDLHEQAVRGTPPRWATSSPAGPRPTSATKICTYARRACWGRSTCLWSG
ncbi:hypothetical protein ACFQZ4_39645 [Catellatospora coxensis]